MMALPTAWTVARTRRPVRALIAAAAKLTQMATVSRTVQTFVQIHRAARESMRMAVPWIAIMMALSDGQDECPATVAGATVDARGCEMDGDDDGVVDRLDQCPNSAPGVQVDISGCEIEEEISLPGVNFESNSDRLLPGAENVLDAAAATLQKNPEISVEVAGHTDSDGAAEYNLSLSERRAVTVRDYLIREGVAASRFTVRGYGESQPVADNGSSTGKAANRRVVLRITDR